MPKTRAALTEKQRRFVERYLVHGNATRAAKSAGYRNPHVAGSTVAKHSAVAAAIAAGQSKTTARNVMERDEALALVAGIARDKRTPSSVRIAAVARASRMQGWDAPEKLEHGGPGRGPIQVQSVPATREQAVDALRLAKARDAALAADLKKLGDEP